MVEKIIEEFKEKLVEVNFDENLVRVFGVVVFDVCLSGRGRVVFEFLENVLNYFEFLEICWVFVKVLFKINLL